MHLVIPAEEPVVLKTLLLPAGGRDKRIGAQAMDRILGQIDMRNKDFQKEKEREADKTLRAAEKMKKIGHYVAVIPPIGQVAQPQPVLATSAALAAVSPAGMSLIKRSLSMLFKPGSDYVTTGELDQRCRHQQSSAYIASVVENLTDGLSLLDEGRAETNAFFDKRGIDYR